MIDTHTNKFRRDFGNKTLLSTRLYPLVEIAMRNYDVKRYDLIHPTAILHMLNPTGLTSGNTEPCLTYLLTIGYQSIDDLDNFSFESIVEDSLK